MVLCLAENIHLDTWEARFPYLAAKWEEHKIRLYEMDLLWLDVKRHYSTELPKPSDIAGNAKVKDNRSVEEIKKDIINKLRRG